MSNTRQKLWIPIISNGSMTGVAVISTSAGGNAYVDISTYSSFSVHAVWTGTPTGTFAVQFSNDTPTPTNWTTPVGVLDTALSNPSGSASNSMGVFYTPYKWMRMTYTNTSSTGTLNVMLFGRGE